MCLIGLTNVEIKPLNQNKMKNRKEKKAFSQGMGAMLIASIGTHLFGQGGWTTYLGLAVMITALVIVYTYVKSE
jgi:hypothetical protein